MNLIKSIMMALIAVSVIGSAAADDASGVHHVKLACIGVKNKNDMSTVINMIAVPILQYHYPTRVMLSEKPINGPGIPAKQIEKPTNRANVDIRPLFHDLSVEIGCRDRLKIALTVPNGMAVVFALFRAPILASRFSDSTVWTVCSDRGGLPSLFPLARATLRPAMVRSDILARSCFARLANIETITSLNGPVESSHCS